MSDKQNLPQEPDPGSDPAARDPGRDQDHHSLDAAAADLLFEQQLRRVSPRTARIDIHRILASAAAEEAEAGVPDLRPVEEGIPSEADNAGPKGDPISRPHSMPLDGTIFDPLRPSESFAVHLLSSGAENHSSSQPSNRKTLWRSLGAAWLGGMVMGGCLMFLLLNASDRKEESNPAVVSETIPAPSIGDRGMVSAERAANPFSADQPGMDHSADSKPPAESFAGRKPAGSDRLIGPLFAGWLLKNSSNPGSGLTDDFNFFSKKSSTWQPTQSAAQSADQSTSQPAEAKSFPEYSLQIQLLPNSKQSNIRHLTEKLIKEIL
jgi:hypothetical protein